MDKSENRIPKFEKANTERQPSNSDHRTFQPAPDQGSRFTFHTKSRCQARILFATNSGSSHIGKWLPLVTRTCRAWGNSCFHRVWKPNGSLRSPNIVSSGSPRN